MIEQLIFTFTISVLAMASIKMGGAVLGNAVTLPNAGFLSPTHFLFMYPSTLYQAYFWSERYLFNV